MSMSIPESHLAQEAIAALVDGELPAGPAGAPPATCPAAAVPHGGGGAAGGQGGAPRLRGRRRPGRTAVPALRDPVHRRCPGRGRSRHDVRRAGELTVTGASGSWSLDSTPQHRPGSEHTARWLRRGLIGTLDRPRGRGDRAGPQPARTAARVTRSPRGGPAAGSSIADRHTEVVPPVVRTLTVGTSGLARAGRPEQPERDARRPRARQGRVGPHAASDSAPAVPDGFFARPPGRTGPFVDAPTGWRPGRWRRHRRRPPADRLRGRRRSTAGSPATARPRRRGPACPLRRGCPRLRPSAPGLAGLQDPGGRAHGGARPRARWKSDARSDPWRDPSAPAALGRPRLRRRRRSSGPVVVDGRAGRSCACATSRCGSRCWRCSPSCSSVRSAAAGWLLTRTAAETRCWPRHRAVGGRRGHHAGARLGVRHRRARHPGGGLDRGARRPGRGDRLGRRHRGRRRLHRHQQPRRLRRGRRRGCRDPRGLLRRQRLGRPHRRARPGQRHRRPQGREAGLVPPSSAVRDVVVGDPVVAIGSPLGLAGTVTTGIVSALERRSDWPARAATPTPSSAPCRPTPRSTRATPAARWSTPGAPSSASTPPSPRSAGAIGLGFAIPIDTVRDIAEQLISTGTVHASLGVNARSVTDVVRNGALVLNVEPGSAAATAGIREQDVVIAVEGKPVRSSRSSSSLSTPTTRARR